MQKVTSTTLINDFLIAHHTSNAPVRATQGAAAWDLWACGLVVDKTTFDLPPQLHIVPHRMITLNTGVRLEFTALAQVRLHYADIRLRSGHRGRGLSLNGDAIIDCDYTGEILLKVWNVSDTRVTIDTTKPLAQMLFSGMPVSPEHIPPVLTQREAGNAGGFGSTTTYEAIAREWQYSNSGVPMDVLMGHQPSGLNPSQRAATTHENVGYACTCTQAEFLRQEYASTCKRHSKQLTCAVLYCGFALQHVREHTYSCPVHGGEYTKSADEQRESH